MTVQPATGQPIKNFSLREAADRYHVSAMTLRRRIRTGDLPAVTANRPTEEVRSSRPSDPRNGPD